MSSPASDPLDDVAFLARSAHRVRVLETLAEGALTRRDLHEGTGVSQPTLGRVLGAFEDRNWVERRGREYALTSWGELVAAAFVDLLDTVGTVQRFGDVVGLLPTDRMDFDVERFESATVTTPLPGDVLRHVRRAEELIDGANHVRILTDTISPRTLEDQHERLVNGPGDLLLESVITGNAIEQALATPALVELIRDLLESGRAPVHRYDGTIPMTLVLADDVAILAPADEHGIPGALIETEDAVVRDWVEGQFEAYRIESTELTVEDLPE